MADIYVDITIDTGGIGSATNPYGMLEFITHLKTVAGSNIDRYFLRGKTTWTPDADTCSPHPSKYGCSILPWDPKQNGPWRLACDSTFSKMRFEDINIKGGIIQHPTTLEFASLNSECIVDTCFLKTPSGDVTLEAGVSIKLRGSTSESSALELKTLPGGEIVIKGTILQYNSIIGNFDGTGDSAAITHSSINDSQANISTQLATVSTLALTANQYSRSSISLPAWDETYLNDFALWGSPDARAYGVGGVGSWAEWIPVKENGQIWNGDPSIFPPLNYAIGPTIGLPGGYTDIMFQNHPEYVESSIIGNFYLCMSGPQTLADQSHIVKNRNTQHDIFLFNNRETASKVIKRRLFTNNVKGTEIIIRFQRLEEPEFNFYSGIRERNTDYLNGWGVEDTYEPGMFRFLINSEMAEEGIFQLAVEAGQVGSYKDGFISIRVSPKRGKLIIANSIIDEAVGSETLSTPEQPYGVVEALDTDLSVYLGGNTFLFRGTHFNFKARSQMVVFGNVFEYPNMEVPFLFDMPSGNLYFHNNVSSATINYDNLVPPTRIKDLYKNRFSDKPIIDYSSYRPIEEEHTIHHHNEKVSIVDDAMEELNIVDRISFDSSIPLDTNTPMDSVYGIPWLLKDALQYDIFGFLRGGDNNRGDAGAICLSYNVPAEETIEIFTPEEFKVILERYWQHPRFDTAQNLIVPEQLRHPLRMIIKEDISVDYVFLLGLWMGRHGGLYISGFKNPSTEKLPVIKGIFDFLEGNVRVEMRNILVEGKVWLGSTMFPSEFNMYRDINKITIEE